MSCVGTVIQNYFKISNASYTPSVILYEFIYNLRILTSETFHVLLENRAWRILSRPPGNILRLAILVDVGALTNVMLTPTHRIFPCQKWCNATIEVFTSNTKSVAYSSQGSHTSQLDFCNRLADGSMTDNVIALSSIQVY